MGLTKQILLNHLAQVGEGDAQEVARAFGVTYSVAAMGLLRLVRQGLASRRRQDAGAIYRYHLTERGQSRLMYLRSSGGEGDKSLAEDLEQPEGEKVDRNVR
jgi:DNA-binding MarR family transcriptional regulator